MLNRNGTKKLAEIVRVILEDIDKRDSKKEELEEADEEDNTNCTPGQDGKCADEASMGGPGPISEDGGEDDSLWGKYADDEYPHAPWDEPKEEPLDLDDPNLEDREHAYWVQDPKMWEAFKEYLTNGGLRRGEVTEDTFKLLSKARAKLDAGKSIEFIGKEGTPEHDINMNFQDAIEDHHPTFWFKKSKENKMNESKKLTRSMLKAILLEEYRNVVEAYPPGTPKGRTSAQLAADTPSHNLTFSDEEGDEDSDDSGGIVTGLENEEKINELVRLLNLVDHVSFGEIMDVASSLPKGTRTLEKIMGLAADLPEGTLEMIWNDVVAE